MNNFDQMLLALFNEAKSIFFIRERDNILNGVAERALCGRLAIYFEQLLGNYNLNDYYADPEYNRMQDGRVKTILDDNMEVVTINCDLIIHSRGAKILDDNLIAVEMKKSHRPQSEKVSDKNRLRALTKSSFDGVWSYDGIAHPEFVCGYHLGFYLEIDKNSCTYISELFLAGNFYSEKSGTF